MGAMQALKKNKNTYLKTEADAVSIESKQRQTPSKRSIEHSKCYELRSDKGLAVMIVTKR